MVIPTPSDVLYNPEEYARTFLYILDKQKRKQRLTYNQAQLHYLNNRTRRDYILKARQLGMSTAIQAEFFRVATTRAAGTMTLAHDDDTTQRLRRMADFYYDNLPDGFKPTRKYANASVTTYPLLNSEAAIGTAGSLKVGRGFTLTHFHGSEVAFWPDAESILAGAMQAGNPAIVLESTPNGAQGYFYEGCMEALDGNKDINLFFFPWWWDPEYRKPLELGEEIEYTAEEQELVDEYGLDAEQINWRRAKKRELKHLFPQEYPEDPITCFLLSGTGYFGDISGVRKVKLGSVQYNPDHRYFAGLDFAQTVDWLSLSIIDDTTGAEVDLLRIQRLPWKELRKRVIDKFLEWSVIGCQAESNSMGTTNIEALQTEMQEHGCHTVVEAFETNNDSKHSIMSALHESMHSKRLAVLDDPIRLKELRVFTSSQTKTGLWQLAAPAGEHDDTVISLGLAHYARTHHMSPAGMVDWA